MFDPAGRWKRVWASMTAANLRVGSLASYWRGLFASYLHQLAQAYRFPLFLLRIFDQRH
jgi:hypothetical protein